MTNFGGIFDDLQTNLKKTLESVSISVRPEFATGATESLAEYANRSLRPLTESLTKALQPLLASYELNVPKNWPSGLRDFDSARAIIETEGIPLIYVPNAELVARLLEAGSADDRRSVLAEEYKQVAADCITELSASLHEDVRPQAQLGLSAARALQAGHFEPAQALAVTVCDTLLKNFVGGSYTDMQQYSKIDDIDSKFSAGMFRMVLAVAAVEQFLTPWWPNTGTPMPDFLNRHVTVHLASPEHYTEANAVIAVALAASLLIAFSETETLAANAPKEDGHA